MSLTSYRAAPPRVVPAAWAPADAGALLDQRRTAFNAALGSPGLATVMSLTSDRALPPRGGLAGVAPAGMARRGRVWIGLLGG